MYRPRISLLKNKTPAQYSGHRIKEQLTMNIKDKMNSRFRPLQGGIFTKAQKADVGDGVAKFQAAGGEVMSWADPFYPYPSLPE